MPQIKTLKDKDGNTVYEVDYRVMVDGVSVGSKKRLKGVSIHEARHFLNTKVNEIYAGKYVQKKKRYRMSKLIQEYLEYSRGNKTERTSDADKRVLNMFLEFVGDLNMNKLSGFILEKYKRERLKTRKRSTVNFETAKIKAFTSWCEKTGYVDFNPFKHVNRLSEEQRDFRVLSAEEEDVLLACSGPRTRVFIEIALNTGMRHREILNLRWADIDFRDRALSVVKSKTKETRTIPINSRLYGILLEKYQERECDWVISCDGKKMRTIDGGFNAAVIRAKIPHIRIHDLRHTFITNLLHVGVDDRTIMEFSGHKTYSMFKRYSHPQKEHQINAIERLADAKTHNKFGRNLETFHKKKSNEDVSS